MLTRRIALLVALVLLLAPCTLPRKKPPTSPININTANSTQLQTVPGIGPSTAEKILQMRKSYGPFKSVGDLMAIRGLGAKRMDKMKKYLTVGRPPAATAAKPANCVGCSKSQQRPPPKTAPATPKSSTARTASQPQAAPTQAAETEEP